MIRYLLDTCVISDFVKGETGTINRLKQTDPAEVAVSTVTVMELHYGLVLNPERAQKIAPAIASILSVVRVLSFEAADAEYAAQIRVALKTTGKPIGAYDVLIAATALRHSLKVVTANQREFE